MGVAAALLAILAVFGHAAAETYVDDKNDCPKGTLAKRVRDPLAYGGRYWCRDIPGFKQVIIKPDKHPRDPCPEGTWWHGNFEPCYPILCTRHPNGIDIRPCCPVGTHEHENSGADRLRPIKCVADYGVTLSNEATGGAERDDGRCAPCIVRSHRYRRGECSPSAARPFKELSLPEWYEEDEDGRVIKRRKSKEKGGGISGKAGSLKKASAAPHKFRGTFRIPRTVWNVTSPAARGGFDAEMTPSARRIVNWFPRDIKKVFDDPELHGPVRNYSRAPAMRMSNFYDQTHRFCKKHFPASVCGAGTGYLLRGRKSGELYGRETDAFDCVKGKDGHYLQKHRRFLVLMLRGKGCLVFETVSLSAWQSRYTKKIFGSLLDSLSTVEPEPMPGGPSRSRAPIIMVPTNNRMQPYIRVTSCPKGTRKAVIDWPSPGDMTCKKVKSK